MTMPLGLGWLGLRAGPSIQGDNRARSSDGRVSFSRIARQTAECTAPHGRVAQTLGSWSAVVTAARGKM